MPFPVLDLANFVANRPENLGTKEKFWLTPRPGVMLNCRPHLFKIGRPNTGENWSERVSCEIARALSLPSASYEFAEYGDSRGVLTERFIPDTGTFFLGNIILSRSVSHYDNTKTYNQLDYKISTVLQIIKWLRPKPPISINECAFGLDGFDYFLGYLIFDCLIGNTDRHHENWGMIINKMDGKEDLHLAPSFDHASCLGRNESDERRNFRLTTKDSRASVDAYAQRTRTAFYGGASGAKALKSRELMVELTAAYPKAAQLWSTQIAALTDRQFCDIFEQVPSGWISRPAIEFALSMLRHNREMIKEVSGV